MNFKNRDRIVRIAITAFIAILFALMFWPFLMPMLVAALFAFAFENLVTRLSLRFKNQDRGRRLITLALLLTLCLFVVIPIGLIIVKAISTIKDLNASGLQNSETYRVTEKYLTSGWHFVTEQAKRFDVDLTQIPQLGEFVGKASQSLAGAATNIISSLPERALALAVFLATLYYFLVEAKTIKKTFVNLQLLNRKELNRLIGIVQKSSFVTIIASALIGTLQAMIVATFAYFCGFTEFTLVFIVTFLFSLVPLIGAAPVALFLSVVSLLQGQNSIAAAMAIAALIAGSIDNILKPIIVSSTSDEQLHPVLSLLVLIGAIMFYGAAGILLGPILTQLTLQIVPILFPSETDLEIGPKSD